MKISSLIRKLQYELDSTGDSDIYISIDTTNKHELEITNKTLITTKNLVTSLDDIGKGKYEFGIRNWMM